MHLSIGVVRGLLEELQRHGGDYRRFAADTELQLPELADANFRIPIERARIMVDIALKCTTISGLGLHVGESSPVGALHTVVGHLLATARDTRTALLLLTRYSSLFLDGARFYLIEQTEVARFAYVHPIAESPYERFAAECSLVFALRRGLQLTGAEQRPEAAHFCHAAPDYADEYERVFGCPVLFSQPSNELVFDRRLLDLTQAYRDDALHHLLVSRADQLLADALVDEQLVARVSELLKLQLHGPDPEEVAQRLGLTLRSLQRRLQENGESLSRLLDQARHDAACTLLSRPDLAIKDIAERTGFSEPSAFHRAFKRWKGVTPAQFRQAQLG
jgi:AraC-like DNA-binding protein